MMPASHPRTRVSSFHARLSHGAAMVVDGRQQYTATVHTHDCDMLFVPVAGRFEFVDGVDRHLHTAPGSFIWFSAGTPHATIAQTLRQTHVAIYVQPDLWATALKAQGIGLAEQGVRAGNGALNALTQRALALPNVPGCEPAAYCGAIIMEAARLCANPVLRDAPLASQHVAALLADQILRELDAVLAIDVFAHRHLLSRRQVERLFRQETGMSPLAFQQLKRAERARYLLENSDESVLSVSQQVGWESGSYLVRMMKQFWALTPTQIRARHRQ
ncbi:MAG: helix-turn-helix transcriptional regulator [Burkholderiales bacterium]|nr:helix-turn-helix transcriptional regulator [Burkholderiales bacterium]